MAASGVRNTPALDVGVIGDGAQHLPMLGADAEHAQDAPGFDRQFGMRAVEQCPQVARHREFRPGALGVEHVGQTGKLEEDVGELRQGAGDAVIDLEAAGDVAQHALHARRPAGP